MNRFLSPALFAGAFFIGVFVTAFVRWPPVQSSDWASWVQAVGSIIAIGVAILVPARQQKMEKIREHQRSITELKRKFEAWEGIARAAIEVIRDMPASDAPLGQAEIIILGRDLRIRYMTASEALASIQIENVHPYAFMTVILELRRDLAHLDRLLAMDAASRSHLGSIARDWLRMTDQIEDMRARATGYEAVFARNAEEIKEEI